MPPGKQKNRKHRKRGPDGRYQEETLARTPSPEAGPSNRLPAPSTPNTSNAPTTPPGAPQPTRTRSGFDNHLREEPPARIPSPEARPPRPATPPLATPPLATPPPATPHLARTVTSPPRAPQPTRTTLRPATPPRAATPRPVTPPRPATWNYREPIQDESPISEDLLLRHSLPHHPIYSPPICSQ